MNVKTTWSLIRTIGMGLLVCCTTGCALFQSTDTPPVEPVVSENVKNAKSEFTPEQAYQIGKEMTDAILKRFPRIENDEAQVYLNKVGQYVALHLDNGKKNIKCVGGREKALPLKGFRFTMVSASKPMTVSVPGGFVFISDSMVKSLKSEDELAGVLAHEATHVVCQDGFSGAMLDAARSSDVFLETSFSKTQEKVADRGALVALYKSGHWPMSYIALIESFQDQTASRHPGSVERVNWLKHDYLKMEKRVRDTQSVRAKRFETFQKLL